MNSHQLTKLSEESLEVIMGGITTQNNKHIFLYPFQYLTKQLLLN